ncbi:MAG: peptidoglycan recognition family protein [Synechococcaceae cyanobacterium]|nr:peptidoglycan recognition family protein [Synechococcaceae cyanobacterium]
MPLRSAPALLRAAGALAAPAVLLVLAGCGPRPAWEVQHLADPGLPRLPPERIGKCRQQLGLAEELERPADATNFGERQPRDSFGRAVPHRPALIVLHETVLPAADTLRFFATPHPRDEDQASYHLLVDRNGRRLRIVPDARRAYGAGMSAFGDFTVRIRPGSVGSINNVALHVSLETPADGRGDAPAHSGYTTAQYESLAGQILLWQARHGIPMSRLTTHAAVDRSHSRYDPRSFRWDRFDAAYRRAAGACGFPSYDTGRATY